MTLSAAWQRALVCLALAGCCSESYAQTQTSVGVPGRGAGSFSVTAEHVSVTEGKISQGGETIYRNNAYGEIAYRNLFFEFDYGLTDRLALTATLPLSSNRYSGTDPHRLDWLLYDHGEEPLDDGNYHTYWTDLGIGVRWAWRTSSRLAVTPFASFYTPTNNYPLYGLSQPARGQARLDMGLNASGRIGDPRLNLYWKAGYAFSYVEETKPIDAPPARVNRSRMMVEVGWRATPSIAPFLVFTNTQAHNAVDILEIQGLYISDQWYYHDQILPWEQTSWTAGVGYQLNDRMGLSFGYSRSSKVEFGFFLEPAVSIGFSYGFARSESGGRR